jgi:hypothetical protein
MAKPGFYDHNEGISYPFQDGSIGRPASEVGAASIRQLPTETIVDMGIQVGPDMEFASANEHFYLRSAAKASSCP